MKIKYYKITLYCQEFVDTNKDFNTKWWIINRNSFITIMDNKYNSNYHNTKSIRIVTMKRFF